MKNSAGMSAAAAAAYFNNLSEPSDSTKQRLPATVTYLPGTRAVLTVENAESAVLANAEAPMPVPVAALYTTEFGIANNVVS